MRRIDTRRRFLGAGPLGFRRRLWRGGGRGLRGRFGRGREIEGGRECRGLSLRLDLQRLRQVIETHVHALQRGQGHALHFQRLDGGPDGFGVLLQPELHRLQLLNALLQLFGVQGGGHPTRRRCRSRSGGSTAWGEVFQKIKARNELGEIETAGLGHGCLLLARRRACMVELNLSVCGPHDCDRHGCRGHGSCPASWALAH